MANFALIGSAGYIAPRHLKAIAGTGGRLLAATDPHDSVGVLDRHFLDVKYFPEIERFDRFMEKVRRGPEEGRVHYVSICSPNYLHDAHIRLALRVGAHAICEKPLVINPWNLDPLARLEEEHGCRISTILQLRAHPELIEVKRRLAEETAGRRHEVQLTYVTGRGPWYHASWKGNEERSGGLATNIGIHLFDLLLWLFGPAGRVELHVKEPSRMAGFVELERADVRWFLSVDVDDLPFEAKPGASTTHRSIDVDGAEVEFSEGFADLHTRVYERILEGKGFGVEDARPSVELAHRIRTSPPGRGSAPRHPLAEKETR
ncbi:MAG: Gfo/Idh/MocA family oxidoreductase [Deltaproteobacteria bacterium]|nr:Gfo/Idh/MocA family oxidoreductase [Deltaproteobacteria bacterium]